MTVASRFALRFIATYQDRVGPRIGTRCPQTPSCSAYGAEMFRRHGVVRASVLTARRVARCGHGAPA